MVKCEICKKNFKNNVGLGVHINKHNINSKEYYDMYLKKDGEGICPTCGKSTKYLCFAKGYAKHCSNKCTYNDLVVREKTEQTMLSRYGTSNVYASEYGKQKIKETKLNRYNDIWYHNTEKAVESYKKTVKNRSIEQTQAIGKKISNTFYNLPEEKKCERTKKISNSQKNYYNSLSEEEHKELCNKRHESAINRTEESLMSSHIKATKTKLSNNTMNISKVEDDFYIKLLNIFEESDIKCQYFDETRYPYACDFYIKSLDLFIEINNHWTHGQHPFDSNNLDDIKKLNIAKEKSKSIKFYRKFINVWTSLDVKKYEIAVKNKLNYMRLYNNDDMNKAIVKLKEIAK